MKEKTLKKRVVTPAMLLVTIGVVYGDIGTSPMYVLKSIIENNGGHLTFRRIEPNGIAVDLFVKKKEE